MITGVIYSITNLKNKKKYIGLTINPKRRWIEHRSYLKNGNHCNKHLQKSFDKYGENNFKFEIIEENIKRDKLDEREIFWIKYYNTLKGRGYNQTKGGSCGLLGFSHTESTKEKISKAKSGKNHPMYGKKFSKKVRQRMSKSKSGEKHHMYGKHHSEETKNKISKNHADVSGINNPSAKVTKNKGIKIFKEYHNTNKTYKEISDKYNISFPVVGRIARKEHWTTKNIKV